MQRVRLGDITVAFEERGQGEPLVLIHGGLVSMRSWRDQTEHFAKTHRVIRFDLRGHGQTTRSSGAYTVPRFADDVEALLGHLDIESFFCWGHSLGGMIAQELARRDDARVRGLILADTTYTTNQTLTDQVSTALSRAVLSLSSVKQIGSWASTHLGGRSPEVGAYVREEFMEQARSRENAHKIFAAVFRFDARQWLHHLRCPTLIMAAQDNDTTRRQGVQMAERIPGAEYVLIEEAGHMVHWDNREAVHEAVERFLERLDT